VRFPSGPPPEY